jgi:hypothetical protein
VAYGGVFEAASGGATWAIDINDTDGGVSTANALATTATTADAFGRTVITGITNVPFAASQAVPAPVTFVSYAVGPEAIRIIDVDTTDSAVGSAFGQGSATFSNTSLGSSVFTLLGQVSEEYATLGQFTTDTNGNITAGVADDNELYNAVQLKATPFTGTYSLTGSTNGYGTITLAAGDVGHVSSMGLYVTDPALNLNDPNNTTTDVGGALLVDLDAALPGGIGVITPQTDATASDFAGSYAAGFQDFNSYDTNNVCDGCEFDMVGPFTVTGGALNTASIGADDSDPLYTIPSDGGEGIGDRFLSTPLAISPGYFSMPPSNSLIAWINGGPIPFAFYADIYQASGTTLYWLSWEDNNLFLGPLEAQPANTTFPGIKEPAAKTQAKHR